MACSARDGINIFQRAAQLHADEITRGVGSKTGLMKNSLKFLGELFVLRRDRADGRETGGYFGGKRRTGKSGHAWLVPGFGDDLADALASFYFEPFAQAQHR